MSTAIIPIPRAAVNVRVATMADVAFMDALQKKHSGALGYFPTKQFEGYVGGGHVLVAEESDEATQRRSDQGEMHSSFPPSLRRSVASSLGYIISKDRYLKRDELGVIFQLCVVPDRQRGLIGASLVKAAFERSAYGCRLYCCWCAQDLEANHFWESLGFLPIAFRAGSRRGGRVSPSVASSLGRSVASPRVHIFWQKRICEGDDATPWWYPFQTSSGAIRQDRVVLPIPPGVHWSEVKAVELPGASGQLPVVRKAKRLPNPQSEIRTPKSAGPGPGVVGILVGGRIKYVPRPGYAAPVQEKAKRTRASRPVGAAEKIDPRFLAKARELRDRWLEHVNSGQASIESGGKYDVSRALPARAAGPPALRALPDAA
jgi:hypothetical protein